MLRHQLASLVRNPPTALDVRVRVFFSHDDPATENLLAAFAAHRPPGIEWHWHALPTPQLMRRTIGRNLAARRSPADWLWFTDCDVLFGAGCLDALADRLRGQSAVLVHPGIEWTTDLLRDSAIQRASVDAPLDCEPNLTFTPHAVTRATGPLQIVRGDVVRRVGYCAATPAFLTPATHWCKTREDRVFRWLLGTQGQGLAIPRVQRIRHLSKGRYGPTARLTALRQSVRRAKDDWLRR
ncbi:glycosyltransferase family 2 protein [Polycyclovorans algicola]|uniref:glycosyltransferase family 2 protein n=1 Tax=Polycyclovorans algicola TaxID=616992 RepID=UPI0006942EA2|nr:glycosyltransferase family A protein [Polycyclovorans algicola]